MTAEKPLAEARGGEKKMDGAFDLCSVAMHITL